MKIDFNYVYLCHSGIVLKGCGIIDNSIFSNVPKGHFIKYSYFKLLTERKSLILQDNCLIVHNHWSAGYHHWITESLVRLSKVNTTDYTLIFPEEYPAFAKQSLEFFDFKNIIYLKPKTGAFVKSLTIPENPRSGYYVQKDLLKIKDLFFRNWSISNSEVSKRVYVTRKNSDLRFIENEKDVIKLLSSKDFLIVQAEDLSFREQVTLFSSCKVFISIHGAALTNCLFMASKTSLLELYRQPVSPSDEINKCYKRMSDALGINHHYLFCKTGKNYGKHIDKINLIVDLEMLEEAINSII